MPQKSLTEYLQEDRRSQEEETIVNKLTPNVNKNSQRKSLADYLEEGKDTTQNIESQRNLNLLRTTPDINADKEAERYKLSKESGRPLSMVRGNEDIIGREVMIGRHIIDAPGMHRYLSDISNAAISYDDTKELKDVIDYKEKTKRAWGTGKITDRINILTANKILMGGNPDYIDKQILELETQLKDIEPFQADGFFEKLLTFTAEQAPQMITSMLGRGVERATTGMQIGALGSALQPEAAPVLIPAGAGVGFTVGTTESIFYKEFGGAYREFSEIVDKDGNKLDPGLVKVMALGVGGINAALELVSLKALLKTIPGGSKITNLLTTKLVKEVALSETVRPALTRIALNAGEAWGTEIVTELLQETTNVVFEELGKKIENLVSGAIFKEFDWESFKERMKGIFQKTAYSALGFILPGTAVSTTSVVTDSVMSKNFNEDIKETKNLIEKTKTQQRSADHAEQFLKNIGEDAPVYISKDWFNEFYFQNEEEGESILKKINIDPKEAKAKASFGTDIEVSKAKIIAQLTQEEFNKISDDLKPAPSAYTQRELNNQNDTEETNNLINIIKQQEAQNALVNEQLERLKNEIVETGVGEISERDIFAKEAPRLLKGYADRLALSGVDRVETLSNISFKRERFETVKKLIAKGKAVFQPTEGIPTEARGATFVQNEKYKVYLFENADLSTVLHELGHVTLLEYNRLEKTDQANQELRNDLNILRKWVSAKKGQDITRDQSEQIARGMEAYFMEGKAPTTELQSVFTRLKNALLNIYQTAKDLKVKLKPDVRKVFDRMFSANLEIENAMQTGGFAIKTDKEMSAIGMNPADQAYAKRQIEKTKQVAQENLTKARNKNYRENIKQWREEAKNEVREDNPIYDTIDSIVKEMPASREEFIETYGEEAVKLLPHNKILKSEGETLNAVAANQGYDDFIDLFNDLFDTIKLKDAIAQRLNQKIAEHDAQFKAEDFIVDSKEYRDYLEIIARNISKQIKGKGKPHVVTQQRLKQLAMQTINAMTVEAARKTRNFMSAIKKAAADERRAVLRKDWAAASKANELQRFNFEMANESAKIRTEIDTIQKQIKQIAKKKKKATILNNYRQAILTLIDRYKLAALRPDDKRYIPKWNELFAGDGMNNDGFQMPEYFSINYANDYRHLTMPQLHEVKNAILYLAGQGNIKKRETLYDGVTKISDVGGGCIDEMDEQGITIKNRDRYSPLKKMTKEYRKAYARQMNLPFILKAFGGYKSLIGKISFLENQIAEKIKDMRDNQINMRDDSRKRIAKARDHIMTKQRNLIKKYGRKLFVAFNKVPVPLLLQNNGEQLNYWTPEQIFAMAFNRGNDSNTNALLNGYEGLTIAQIDSLLEQYLTIEDMDAVQDILNEFERLRPMTEKVYLKIKNYSMKIIEPREWRFLGKRYKGGYYPLEIDRHLATKKNGFFGTEKEESDFFENNEKRFSVPYAKDTHTIERKEGHGLPIDLRLIYIDKHIDKSTRYITMAEGIGDVNKIINYREYELDPETQKETKKIKRSFRRSAEKIMGEEVFNEINPALQYFVNPQVIGNIVPGNKVFRWLRQIAIPAHLAWRSITAVKQTSSFFGGVNMLGAEKGITHGSIAAMNGIMHCTMSPVASFNEMNNKSAFMRERNLKWERDFLKNQFDKMTPAQREISFGDRNITWEDAVDFGYVMIRLVDRSVVTPVWWGAYLDKINENGTNEKEAVRYADNIIEETQPTAEPLDLTPWLRERGLFSPFILHQTFTVGIYGQRQRAFFRAWKTGQISTMKFARFNFMESVLPILYLTLLTTWLRGGDVSDEDTQKEITEELFVKWFGMGIPFADSLYYALKTGWKSPLEVAGAEETKRWISTIRLLTKGFDDMTAKERDRAILGLAEMISDWSRVPFARVYKQLTEGETIKEKTFGVKKKR